MLFLQLLSSLIIKILLLESEHTLYCTFEGEPSSDLFFILVKQQTPFDYEYLLHGLIEYSLLIGQ